MIREKKMFTSYVKNKNSHDTIIFGDGNQGKDKSETQETLKRFLRRAQNEFELKVKKIRSDKESEFKNLQVEEYLEEEGIKHEFSAPYTPQQNGVV
jgi:transposase InsO family protein